MRYMLITISDELKSIVPSFTVGVISYSNINVQQSATEIKLDLKEISSSQQKHDNVTDINGIKEGRSLFKALGIDPSRYRPSSEALLRRIIKGDDLPSIHSAADVNNLFSIKYALPIGIYDQDKLENPLEIRIGKNSDMYEAINNRETNMSGKLLSADSIGPFGSPIVDSKRTMVTIDTKNALQLIYFHLELDETKKDAIMKDLSEYFTFHHGGKASSLII